MIAWKKQAEAFVGPLQLTHGQRATVVLVGGRENPRGAALVLPSAEGGKPAPAPLADHLEQVPKTALLEILCMQERAFGASGLPMPDGFA